MWERVVVRLHQKYIVDHFNVATGIQVTVPGQSAEEGRNGIRQGKRRGKDQLVSLLEESWPVGEGARHHARVDEVELLAECPCVFLLGGCVSQA